MMHIWPYDRGSEQPCDNRNHLFRTFFRVDIENGIQSRLSSFPTVNDDEVSHADAPMRPLNTPLRFENFNID